MSTTLTIRNLEEHVKQKLRMQAAAHGQSMEAEAREILTRAMASASPVAPVAMSTPAAAGSLTAKKGKFDHVVGIWKGGMSTDDIMQMTRGE